MDVQELIRENKIRNKAMDSPYDPLTGEGSLVPRVKISYTDGGNEVSYLCPMSMYTLPVMQNLIEIGSIEGFIENELGGYCPGKHEQLVKELFDLRLTHDFEFYAYTCVKIPDKESEDLIPFKLNRSQRKLIAKFEKLRLAGKSIRVILTKARQWGGSTATQIYMNWIQLRHRKRWNMAICTLVNAQASHIRNMFVKTVENFPPELGKYTLSNYANSSIIKHIEERDCLIGVGSTQSPENLRSYNIHMLHASEVASWEDTPKKSAKSLMQSLRGTIKNMPYTMVVLESTAKGVGNFFHKEWVSSTTGKGGYDYLFVPWHEIEMYREPIDDINEFIKVLDEIYCSDGRTYWYLWELGATLEGINWYRNHKIRENLDDISMFQEFPSTADEAFSSTGRPAFPHVWIKKMESQCEPPIMKGELRADAEKGKGAFVNLTFEPSVNGNLWIWSLPDKSIKVSNRYGLFADIGGRHRLSDYSVTKVLDRYWMIEGGVPETAAVWHGHVDQDLFAWKSAQLAFWYNKGLLAIESNSLSKDEKDEYNEGDHFLTVLDEIAPFYPNLYARNTPDEVRQNMPTKFGFHTNKSTKPMLVGTLNAALRDSGYVEKDIRALNEMYTFEIKENGGYGSKEGHKDDNVIVTAGDLWLCTKYMPFPMDVVESSSMTGKRIVSEASF
jgi:hypothetical protein